jgi:hypothetical protein
LTLSGQDWASFNTVSPIFLNYSRPSLLLSWR